MNSYESGKAERDTMALGWLRSAVMYLDEQITFHDIATGLPRPTIIETNRHEDLRNYLRDIEMQITNKSRDGVKFAHLAEERHIFMAENPGSDPIDLQVRTLEVSQRASDRGVVIPTDLHDLDEIRARFIADNLATNPTSIMLETFEIGQDLDWRSLGLAS